MKKLDAYQEAILVAHDHGALKSTSPSKTKLTKFKAAASVLHKCVSDRLVEKPSNLTPCSTGRADKRRTG